MKARRDLYLVAFSLFIWGMGEGLFYIFQPLYIQQLGADPILIGSVLGINAVAMTLSQIPAGYLADRVGRRPLMWFTWIMGVISALVMASARNLTAFVAGLLLYGLTSAVLAPMNSYISHARGDWSVGRAVTFTSAAFSIGAIIGPMAGGTIGERFGLRNVYWLAAGLFFISTCVILFIRRQPVGSRGEAESAPGLLRNPRFLMSLGLILMIMFSMYLPIPLAANFLQNERGLNLASIGQLGSLQNLGNAVFALALGHLPALTAFLLGETALLAVSLLLWKGSGMGLLGLAYFLMGGYRLSRTLSVAFVQPMVGINQVGLAFGFVETINNLALILTPILAGILYEKNPESVFMVSVGVLALCLVFTLWSRGAGRRAARTLMTWMTK
ncbi:MAG TPA: MFS transporter [Anaerolineaceae bacterium]|jgi:MFS family permease|nr:MFS transporter [Anaerolineaceae bacterium]HOE35470.1 MFS transporter [Anaerolineaceae bacterium]HOT26321.1 MFS transporter [Anaerolineaceae bacterium]HQH58256.1 MFS transporter [Anaerolineaceae bacterium]HQK03642.1 MFS transporter [Anaerolineaceae bacterium]